MAGFKGITAALVTPLDDNRKPNYGQLSELIEFVIDKGVNAILLLGGTGECTSLAAEDRFRVVKTGVEAVGGRVPVMAGVMDPGLSECLKSCKAHQEAGADALLVLTPFYYAGTQDGIVDYYKTVDREINLPIYIYNIPYRTNVNVLPDTVVRMYEAMDHLAGIKECAGLSQAMELIVKAGDKIEILSGDEFTAVSLMAMGGAGAIMATANVVPEAWVTMYSDISSGRISEALNLSLEHFLLFKALFSENYIGPLKHAMMKRGLPTGMAQILPLADPTDKTLKLVDEQMHRLGYY
ncbi:MAG: 4-hydroxy-tetrahydrodipicolinate synthase [Mogibacterium sp.]|nr:4-hydroxy-tetrahydrodipicolinate synthase [Mogibacterium sp.]